MHVVLLNKQGFSIVNVYYFGIHLFAIKGIANIECLYYKIYTSYNVLY